MYRECTRIKGSQLLQQRSLGNRHTLGKLKVSRIPTLSAEIDLIRAVLSWVTAAGMEYVHIGLDGKGERFDIMSLKPTREKLIIEELGGTSASIMSLKDLETVSQRGSPKTQS